MKAVVALSGGMDSTTVVGKLCQLVDPKDVLGVFMTYGSKHNEYEVASASAVAAHYGIAYEFMDLTAAFRGFASDLLKTGGEVPEGHYEAESMKATVVPGRNMIFSAILAGKAESIGADQVYLGVHAGDHAIYPDCRPEFFMSMKKTIELASAGKVTLYAPYLHRTKADIVKHGLMLDVPYRLTRTCYKNQAIACGKCGSCQERLASFLEAGRPDPLAYETREILPKE